MNYDVEDPLIFAFRTFKSFIINHRHFEHCLFLILLHIYSYVINIIRIKKNSTFLGIKVKTIIITTENITKSFIFLYIYV